MTINACMVALHGAVATLLLTVYCPDVCAQVAVEESAEIRREQRSLDYAVQIYALRSGDTIKHHQYDGLIRRLDADQREVARARVPKADAIAKGTTIVVSANQLRLLVIHEDDQSHFPARHKVAFLDVASLKTLAEPPLGECRDPRGPLPIMAAQLTLTCFHSRPPDEQKRRPTFALVTLNLNRGELVRWVPLGGERNGAWFGPMFFGYRYDVSTVPVEQSPKPCPFDVTLPALDPTAERREHPALVLVLERRKGEAKGEVWFVGADTTVPPRRVAQLEETPRSAVGCEIDGRKPRKRFKTSWTAWMRRSSSSARSTSTRTTATPRNCARSSPLSGSNVTPATSKNSTWRASWRSQNASCRAPRTCGCKRHSNNASGSNNCSFRTESRSMETALFEPAQLHRPSATCGKSEPEMKVWWT